MNIDKLLQEIEKEVVLDNQEEVRQELNEAIRNNQFLILPDNKGFLTWLIAGDKVFINNLFIEKKYRNKNNLLFLRKLFNGLYPISKKFWENRKKGKIYETT